ncbi:aminotransferase class IV [Salinimicrobium soli]|uniref:aminotransferase class IV n=1 Tax=Salinimicrobium soli TaxID=1254399 RepID=UPI003AAE9F80
MKNYPSEVYLNDSWHPAGEAMVSVFDRGFMFGDGLYEVTPFYEGKPFKLQEHLARLRYGLREIKLSFETNDLENLIFKALDRAGLSNIDCAVYLQVTRGKAPRTHHFPQQTSPTFLMYAFPVQLKGFRQMEASIMLAPDFRWQRCDIKSISLMANTMLNSEAIEKGHFENVLFRDEKITEGSHSSIFFVKDQKAYTHPEGPHILSGITRKVVIGLCKELGIPVVGEAVSLQEVPEADEIFLTGTTTQILPVTSVLHDDEEIYKSSEAGKITVRLQDAFHQMTRGL